MRNISDYDFAEELAVGVPSTGPGSEAAHKGGCTCPDEENDHGLGISLDTREPGARLYFLVRHDCPLHGTASGAPRARVKPPLTQDELLSRELKVAEVDYRVMAGVLRDKVEELNVAFRAAYEMGLNIYLEDQGSKGQAFEMTAFGPRVVQQRGTRHPVLSLKLNKVEKL